MNALYEAIRTVQEASAFWCEYLAENDREDECEAIDAANDVIERLVRLLND